VFNSEKELDMSLDPALQAGAATAFQLANALVLPGWLALIVWPARHRFAPRARWWAGRALPLVLAAIYLALFATQGMGDGGYRSLAEVQRLFANPWLLLAGWVHYLAFDLFVGAWIAERAGALGLPHALLIVLLLLTFLFGPVGLLAYAIASALVHTLRQRQGKAMATA
jgi:phage shock protein PspC (stress-responsive transcriptional regulator)